MQMATYSWFNNGTPFASGDVVDLGAYTVLPTSTVTCEVTATDSTASVPDHPPVSSSRTVIQ